MEDAINDFSREKNDPMSTKQPTSPDTTDLQRKHDDIKTKYEQKRRRLVFIIDF